MQDAPRGQLLPSRKMKAAGTTLIMTPWILHSTSCRVLVVVRLNVLTREAHTLAALGTDAKLSTMQLIIQLAFFSLPGPTQLVQFIG